jgi:hypothetical protein
MILETHAKHGRRNPLTWFFLSAFAGSCVLFWWLQSILLHFWLGLQIPLEARFIWISVISLLLFSIGYLVQFRLPFTLTTSQPVLDRCEQFAYTASIIWAIPSLLVALQFAAYRLNVSYGEGHGLSLLEQAVLYIDLFLGLLYIGAVDDKSSRMSRVGIIIALTIAPRLLISLRWGRFFAAQAIVPILFIAIARGWVEITPKRMLQIAFIVLFILFVPAITRGDSIFGEDEHAQPQIVNYFGYMNTLGFFQDNTDIGYSCPPLMVSLTAKIVPYSYLGICTIDVGKDKGLTATLDQLLTKQYSDDIMAGTGSNYLLELYLTGGVVATAIGALLFGVSCRGFVDLIGHRSLYAGIWVECLSRALLAPRGTLGYVYERIPSLLLATWACIFLSWAVGILRRPMSEALD